MLDADPTPCGCDVTWDIGGGEFAGVGEKVEGSVGKCVRVSVFVMGVPICKTGVSPL